MRKIPKETLLLVGLVVAAVVLTFVMTDYGKKADDAEFVADFNDRVPERLWLNDADEIRSVLPGCSMYLTEIGRAHV